MKQQIILILSLTLLLTPAQAFAAKAAAVISGTSEGSTISGAVTFEDTENGLQVQVQLGGLEPGLRGIHIHEKGSCKDKGDAAGGHYNPDQVQHGFLPAHGLTGAHAGDLGNIQINANGQGALFLIVPGLTVKGKTHSVDGRAVILHEKKDDFGQPAGNAGGRIACGIIETVAEDYAPPALPESVPTPTEAETSAETVTQQIISEETQITEKPVEAKPIAETSAIPQEAPKKKKRGWW